MTDCRACGRRILWARTTGGSAMPLDPTPTPDGNVVLVTTGDGPRARVLTKDEPRDGLTIYAPHFATCPNYQRKRRPAREDEGERRAPGGPRQGG